SELFLPLGRDHHRAVDRWRQSRNGSIVDLSGIVDKFQHMLADNDHVVVLKLRLSDSLGVDEDAVGGVEVLDEQAVPHRDDLAVMVADHRIVDDDVVVGLATYGDLGVRRNLTQHRALEFEKKPGHWRPSKRIAANSKGI